MDDATHAMLERILDSFGLTPHQRPAAATRGRNIVVTAGAGSGKTRTLVARYISLLAEGFSPRRVTAITFTEKAAREMRSRVRSALVQQITLADSDAARRRWSELEAQMDAARIGTIHSLCAEILRAHPAEAGVDPRFNVLDEGLSATLRAQAVEVLGSLPRYATATGYLVTPVVGLVTPGFSIAIDTFEVEEVFEPPLAFLMDPAHHERRLIDFDGMRRTFYAMPYEAERRYFIWGATAGMDSQGKRTGGMVIPWCSPV